MLGLGINHKLGSKIIGSEPPNPFVLNESTRQVLQADGVNDFIKLGNFTDLDGLGQWSFSFWFRIVTYTSNADMLFHIGEPSGTVQLYAEFSNVTISGDDPVRVLKVTSPGDAGTAAGNLGYYYDIDGGGGSGARSEYEKDFSENGTGLNRWWCFQFKWNKDENSGNKYARLVPAGKEPNQTGYGDGGWRVIGNPKTDAWSSPDKVSAIGGYYIQLLDTSTGHVNSDFFEMGIWNRVLQDNEFNELAMGQTCDLVSSTALLHHWTFNNTVEDFGSAGTRDESDAELINGASFGTQ